MCALHKKKKTDKGKGTIEGWSRHDNKDKRHPGSSISVSRASYTFKTEVAKSMLVGEAEASYTTRLRSIGNSKGVILNSQIIESAGFAPEADIIIAAHNGIITIMELKDTNVNTDLSTWDKQFKEAIRKGDKSEGDLFEGMKNDFDTKEW